jgi:hypothetical protein
VSKDHNYHPCCNCCGVEYPSMPHGVHLTDSELYSFNWIPFKEQIYCSKCAVRVLAVAVDILLKVKE